MEELPPLGKAISKVVLPTYKIYEPLLLRQAHAIKSTPRESFSYGEHPRQKLDVYTPSNGATGRHGNSILIFLYGGGFVHGDKISPTFPEGLVYANVGHFFAEKLGFKVVIPDYRLISHGAVFPSGGEDLELVIDWVIAHLNHDSSKPLDVYVMGNSAGGIHLSTYLFSPRFSASRQKIRPAGTSTVRLRGVVLLSVPFHFEQADPRRKGALQAYYGSEVSTRSPLGLLKACKEDGSIDGLRGIPIMVLNGSLDPDDEILIPMSDFITECCTSTLVDDLTVGMMEGQNHISPGLSLGTAITGEEAWGQQVIDFITAAGSSPRK